MLWSIWIALTHAGCADGACPPDANPQESTVPEIATAPMPPIDRDRPDDIRTVAFALG